MISCMQIYRRGFRKKDLEREETISESQLSLKTGRMKAVEEEETAAVTEL